jgi:c-di-GMP-related signal transduction protein
MDVYLARQPIFTRKKEISGYELLFRGGMENCFPGIDGDSATSQLLSNTFFNSSIEQITDGKRAFINFTRELLVRKIPLLFPAQVTTVEILENVTPDKHVIECCSELAGMGYMLALDDFSDVAGIEPLIELSQIIKIDFMLSTKEQIHDYAKRFLSKGKRILAEKVETLEEFDEALQMGFTLFQGYFFSKPQIIRGTDVPALKINLLNIMAETRKEDYHVDKLKKLVERDVGISYKLLRYLNSPFFRRTQEITSIGHAISMLGEKGIRSFLSVIILAEMSQDKPGELLKSSIIRARICELLGLQNGSRRPDPSVLFTLGLFSHIDAILDTSMESIMKKMPLAADIKKTLLGEKNVLSDYLDLATSYQQASWDNVNSLAGSLQIDHDKLPKIYFDALGWADSVFLSNQ